MTDRLQESIAPGAKCACGHLKTVHFGDGPCLAAHKLKSGQYADATVCPCTHFEEVEQ